MPQRRHVTRAAVTAAAATACLALAPAWAAAAALTGNPHNPPGDNGTVKIDGEKFEDKVDNQPHVGCTFELEFFNFDQGDTADITLAAQPPSGKFQTVKFLDNHTISDDPAGGAENDHDAVIRFSADDLELAGVEAHPEQGYHVKLIVDLTDGNGNAKHKVFWIQPCETTPTTPPGTPTTPPPTTPGSPGASESGSAGGGGGGDNGGGLPVTGVAATGMALTGVALIGGGALMVLRRRRDNVTFTS